MLSQSIENSTARQVKNLHKVSFSFCFEKSILRNHLTTDGRYFRLYGRFQFMSSMVEGQSETYVETLFLLLRQQLGVSETYMTLNSRQKLLGAQLTNSNPP
jgi:hypothetical protein